jgi:hypothetical protein
LGDKYYGIGAARKALHDEAAAQAAFLKAKTIAEAQLKQSPGDARIHALSAKVLACLGEKGGALLEAQRATELLPESKDAFLDRKLRPQWPRFMRSLVTTLARSKFWRDC